MGPARRSTRMGNRIGDVGVDHPRLHDDALVGNVNFQDTVHASEADDNPSLRRQRTTAESGSRSTCDERNAVLSADTNDRLDLFGGSGKDNGVRYGAKIGQAVAFIRLELVHLRNQTARLPRVSGAYGTTQSIENRPIKHKRS